MSISDLSKTKLNKKMAIQYNMKASLKIIKFASLVHQYIYLKYVCTDIFFRQIIALSLTALYLNNIFHILVCNWENVCIYINK